MMLLKIGLWSLSIYSRVGFNPVKLQGDQVPALIKFGLIAFDRGCAELSHHPEMQPSHCGSLRQPHPALIAV